MYPPFVKVAGTNRRGTRILTICDQDYTAHHYDLYIDHAIELAAYWKPHQISYSRITHLRNWIRENCLQGHNIPYKHIRSMHACKYFVESVIHAEHSRAGKSMGEAYKFFLQDNIRIFSKRKNGKSLTFDQGTQHQFLD